MNERRQDFEQLQRFSREGEQSAFAEVVRRHLDLVFGTAMRKVEDAGGAEEIAQNVFAALARKAWQFAPDDSLPARLHKTALLESKAWLRGELRRRRREQTAAELGTTMNSPEKQPAFQALVPLLDEALLSLREKDRTALLLRFYESQSLRDVGTAFGVSEDTAQKRVQNALEKLTQFFQRRGFKTASVVAAAAALQHTATSASSAVAGTVITAALKVAPPALAGLSLLLARLAGLSRVQTAAVCVVLAAVPVGWQLNERHAAGEDATRYQTQVLAALADESRLQSEIGRLQATAGRLEQSLDQANAAAALAAESAQAFEVWKQRTRGRLLAADYRWDDNSPFVRVPKAVLPEMSKLSQAEPFSPRGIVEPYARELMGLTPAERVAVESILQRHFANVEEALAAGIQETNKPLSGRVIANRVFTLQPSMIDGLSNHVDQVLVPEVRGILGQERWPVVAARLGKPGVITSSDLRSILAQTKQQLRVRVERDAKGTLTMSYEFEGGVATSGSGALTMFLPDGDPNRTDGAEEFLSETVRAGFLSNPLRQRAVAWLREQAIARLGGKEQP
jgi:RNA polymerase sigma factor (sigma-70 family)